MRYYLAPMEEITGYVFRNVFHTLFGGADRYFTPFLAPAKKRGFRSKERKEVDPANNQGMDLVPQLLTNDPEALAISAHALGDLGYREINLNLGCPSATVVPKRKGSGFLADTEELDRFFEKAFSLLPQGMGLSVKTRLGLAEPEEFNAILAVYNRYPLTELIIHPRVQRDFYGNSPRMEIFGQAEKQCLHPLCYNGDIQRAEDIRSLEKEFPSLCAVMIGRGLVANPGLIREIRTGKKTQAEEIHKYLSCLFQAYVEAYGQESNALYKMKEVWDYLGGMFEDSRAAVKKIKKSASGVKYKEAVEELLDHCRWLGDKQQSFSG